MSVVCEPCEKSDHFLCSAGSYPPKPCLCSKTPRCGIACDAIFLRTQPDRIDPTKYRLESQVAEWFLKTVQIEQREPVFVFHVEMKAIGNFNHFLNWLYSSREGFSLSFDGGMYHFRTPAEAQQFAFGFGAAWVQFGP